MAAPPKRLAAGFFLLVFAALGGTRAPALWPERVVFDPAPPLAAAKRYDVRILRDRFGVPHVYGKTDPDVAYGLAFATARTTSTRSSACSSPRGRLATVEGLDAAPADFLFHWLGVPEAMDRYEPCLARGEGAGRRLRRRREPLRRAAPDRVLPGVVPVLGRDVVAGFTFRTPFFYGLERAVRPLFDEEQAPSLAAWWRAPEYALGSNAIAVAPSRAADGATRLLGNSHQPYTGPVAWYEVRLHSESGWDITGGVFPGSPVVLHGANPTLGWASTVNSPTWPTCIGSRSSPTTRTAIGSTASGGSSRRARSS